MNLIMHYESNYVLKLMPGHKPIHARVQICPWPKALKHLRLLC